MKTVNRIFGLITFKKTYLIVLFKFDHQIHFELLCGHEYKSVTRRWLTDCVIKKFDTTYNIIF